MKRWTVRYSKRRNRFDIASNNLTYCKKWEGWEFRAAWDDFKLGLKHNNEFAKIALFGNKNWQEVAAKVGSWFVSGEIKYFDTEGDALAWLLE